MEILYGGSSSLGIRRGGTSNSSLQNSLLRNDTQGLGRALLDTGNEPSVSIKGGESLD